jgi:nitroreductase
MNLQQWEFVVVTGDKKKKLGESYGKAAESYTSTWEEKRRSMALEFAQSYGGAPVIILALTVATDNPSERKMHLESVSAAFENLLLAAWAEGLGTCWMTGPLQDETTVRSILDIPPEKEIVAVTPVGYPDMVAKAPARLDPDLSSKVRWVE